MTRERDGRRLLALLEQFRTMQRRLGDQGIIVVLAKHPRDLERANDGRDGLQLGLGFRDRFLVDRERLHGKLVRELFLTGLVRSGKRKEVQAEADVGRRIDLVVEDRRALVDELEQGREA